MANRYELTAAFTLLRAHEKANNQLWRMSQYMQGVDPNTGGPVLVIDENTALKREALPDDLVSIGNTNIDFIEHINAATRIILEKSAFTIHAGPGCQSKGISLNDIQIDCSRALTVKDYWQTEKTANITKLTEIGEYIEAWPDAQDKQFGLLPDDVYAVLVVHDLIDAAMYNFRGLKSGNGQPLDNPTVEGIQAKAYRRCRTLNSLQVESYAMASGNYKADLDLIYQLADYIQLEYPNLKNLKQCDDMADYIETSIPRLPSWRRWWSY